MLILDKFELNASIYISRIKLIFSSNKFTAKDHAFTNYTPQIKCLHFMLCPCPVGSSISAIKTSIVDNNPWSVCTTCFQCTATNWTVYTNNLLMQVWLNVSIPSENFIPKTWCLLCTIHVALLVNFWIHAEHGHIKQIIRIIQGTNSP